MISGDGAAQRVLYEVSKGSHKINSLEAPSQSTTPQNPTLSADCLSGQDHLHHLCVRFLFCLDRCTTIRVHSCADVGVTHQSLLHTGIRSRFVQQTTEGS